MAVIDTIREFEAKLFALHPEAKKIYELIDSLKDYLPKPKIAEKAKDKLVFDKNASATEQVVFALKYLGFASKIQEIEKAIKQFDEGFNKGLNTPIDKLKRADIIRTYNPNGSNHSVYYALKDWFNEDGKIKEEYVL